ncbi:MAG: prepilin-type N-terminal cleavage/methylation domain-containing protein [Candidatus Gracilibacteria bacterium]|nr:prepilin-type N-terminal cleavage/methylation domain-containing protein [Candidatus Gracilibacteria bacterium]
MKTKKIKGFTLVELIVTIVILIILGTISIISFEGYTKNSRDSVRIADLSLMRKTLELYITKVGTYPTPTNSVDITYSGSLIWKQGTFGESTFINVEKLDKLPLDPLVNTEYTYSITKAGTEYELAGVLEKNTLTKINGVYKTYADGENARALVEGTYNGKMLQTLTGTNCDILALPSIVTSDDTKTTVQEIIYSGSLVYDGFGNLPPTYKSSKFNIYGGFNYRPSLQNLVAYSDNGSCQDLQANTTTGAIERHKLFLGLQDSYSGSVLSGNAEFNTLLNPSQDGGEGFILGLFNKTEYLNTKNSGSNTSFTLNTSVISDSQTATITDNCIISPTGYISSNTAVATISGTTITGISSGTTLITPIGGNCDNFLPKELTVVHVIPEFPFDKLSESTIFKYDNNSSWSNISFQGYGSHDGHKTVKLYVPNGVAGIGIPLGENMPITEFSYTVYQSSNSNTDGHYLAVNQVPSDGDARVYNAQGAFYTSAFTPHTSLGTWKSTQFFKDKILNTNYIYLSSQGGDPFYVEFYVTTGSFNLESNSIVFYKTTNITDSCKVSPTGYTSSNPEVATISGSTIIGVSAGTTTITPVGGNCANSQGKPLTVVGTPPTDISYPFDNLVNGRDESYLKYDNNSSYTNITFQGYGSHDGHKTVKLYVPNGVAGVGIPLLKMMSITRFYYTVYQSSNSSTDGHYLAVNQVPSDGDARVYNAQGAFYTSAYTPHSSLGTWKYTDFFTNKILYNNYIYLSSQGGDPFYVEFYVTTLSN